MDDVMQPPSLAPTIPPHVVPGQRRIHARSLLGLLELLNEEGIVVVAGGGSGGGAALTDTATITWDFSSPGEAIANVVPTALGLFTPTRIPAGETFRVPVDSQVLIALPIVVDGTLIVDGALVTVS